MGLISSAINGILFGGVLAILSFGMNLMFGVMQIIHLAYGQVVMIGIYIVYYLTVQLKFPFLLSGFIAVIASALLGLIIYYLVVRPLLNAELLNQLLALACVWIILENVAYAIFGASYYSIPVTPRIINIGGIYLSSGNLNSFIGSIIILLILYYILNKTSLGLAIRATAQNEDEACLMGIKPRMMYVVTVALGSALAGIVAVFFSQTYATHPYFGGPFTLLAFVIVALGGLGNLAGGVLAAFIIGASKVMIGYAYGSEFAEIAVLLVFIIIMIFRPQGILKPKMQ